LERPTPNEHARIELGINVASVGIESNRLFGGWDRIPDLACYREWPRPIQTGGEIAETFAKKESGV
jgi:hypothetical protein